MNQPVQVSNNRAARVITTAALVSIFIYSFVVSLPSILINDVVEAFSLEGADEGLMGTMTSVGFMFSLFLVVLVQGRAKKTTVLISALAAQAVMLFVSGFSPTFFIFLIGCTLLGFSGGFIDTFTNSAIVDVRKEESTRYLGYLHGTFGIGSLLIPIVFIVVHRYIDWRGAHYALAIASVLVILLIFFLTRGKVKDSKEATIREHLFNKADLLAYVQKKRNVALALTGFFSMFALSCIMAWVVRYMALRFDAAELGALSISIYWVCSTTNRFLLSQIIKRAPMKFFALGCAIGGGLLIIGIFSGSAIVLCIMLGVMGLFSGHFVPVLVSESAVGYEGRTTFTTSIIMFVMCIGRITAPVSIAFVSTQISLTTGMMLPVATLFIAALFGLLAVKANKELNDA